MKITVAGTGYVGLSMAVLLSQHNEVTAVDIIPEKVDMINNKQSPIQDDYIEKYLSLHNVFDKELLNQLKNHDMKNLKFLLNAQFLF